MEAEKKNKKEGNWPAGLYLEGGDQFRGWFNSSLITSTILTGKAPYRQVIAHGFVVDEKGQKLSKSLGNSIDPKQMREKFGTDVLRLWVATADFTKEVRVSEEILKRNGENYQKIRNICRFLLGNLQYLTKKEDLEEELRIIDYWIINKLNELIKYSEEKYKKYEFSNIYPTFLNFCLNSLSSFYFETSKDALYCDSLTSKRRKQIITTLYFILGGILKIIVPVLPFLAEEIYQHIPFKFGYACWESVMLVPSSEFEFSLSIKDTKIIDEFLVLRQDVLLFLEKARQSKLINTSFQAIVYLYPIKKSDPNTFSSLNLNELLMVSKVEFVSEIVEEKLVLWEKEQNYLVKIEKLTDERCFRCWNHNNLQGGSCSRCRDLLKM